MASRLVLWLVLLGAFTAALFQQPQAADAGFHCMRINEVMAGPTIQFVELKMEFAGETLVMGKQLHFFNAAGTETATFTFPSNVTGTLGETSILIGTQAFKDLAGVVDPDFVFVTPGDPTPDTMDPMANPVPNPVLAPDGKVTFTGPFNCQPLPLTGTLIDSVAYGSFTGANTGFGTPAAALPTTGATSLQLTAPMPINGPHNNSTEYSLAAPNPRNNFGQTSSVIVDSDGDGVLDASDNCPNWPNPIQTTLPPWPVVLDGSDPDCDGFSTADENSIGTDPKRACSMDRWPPDFNSDHDVNVIDINIMKPAFFSMGPNPPYQLRLDLKPDNSINVLDINRMKPFFFLSCTDL